MLTKKLFVAGIMACAFAAGSANAQVYVRVGPPPVVVEHPGPRPHPGYVWIQGYQRWDGARYVWVPGRYEAPPRPRAVWVPHHWVHSRHGWVLVEGRWR